jgi:hypothetical protein
VLFAIPTKNTLGLAPGAPAWRVHARRGRLKAERLLKARFPAWITRSDPKLNYADFDRELRARSDLAKLVEGSLPRLAGVVPWIDSAGLWRRHRERRGNHGDALTMLAALELNLSAEKELAGVR